MIRMLATTLMAFSAVIAVSALAYAEETIIEKHTYESQKNTVETVPVVPEVRQKVVEERTVTQPMVQKRTDTVVTTHEKTDNDNDNDNDND